MNALPTGRELIQRILWWTGGYAVLAIVAISLYLSGLLQLTSGQWRGFSEFVGLALLVVFPSMVAVHWNIFRTVLVCLDHRAEGTLTRDELRAGFAAISDFPRYWFVWGLAWWGLGGLIVGTGMWLRYESFDFFSLCVVTAATVSAAFVTDAYYYLNIKRMLEPVRVALATDVGEPEERIPLIRPVSLRVKLLAGMVSVILVTVTFAAFLSRVHSERALVHLAVEGQSALLASVVDPGEIGEARDEAVRYGLAEMLLVLDGRTGHVLDGPTDRLAASDLEWLRSFHGEDGTSEGLVSSEIFSWRHLPGGRIVVATKSREALVAGTSAQGLYVLLLVFSTLVSVGVAFLLARDVDHGIGVLKERAGRIADGDLRPGVAYTAEDELGDLGHAFERMGRSLRTAVGRVAGASERMRSAASEIGEACVSLSQVAGGQARSVEDATVSMRSIDGEVRTMAESSESLRTSMDEASSAIAELEATGAELGDTSNTLLSNVEEVASSISQMVRGTAQVAQNADALAQVSQDAAASMQQTAQAVSDVDANAAQMARISGHVVELSEAGQDHVQETIRGMEAIHDATAAAEGVIRQLAGSTQAIDAVVSVIDDVAEETNLLALNAAIIASQAGEHGKAFAVVADEIKDLADRVLTSTKEIGQLIRAVQDESEKATGAITRGAESVDRGVELSAEAGISLEKITGATRQSGERVDEIVAAMREQSSAAAHVAALMKQVGSGVEHIRQAIWEQGRGTGVLRQSASSMDGVAQQVRNTTAEQARSASHIRESIQDIQGAVTQINTALQEQSNATRRVVELLGSVGEGTRANQESVQRLDESMQDLGRQAGELADEVARFRI